MPGGFFIALPRGNFSPAPSFIRYSPAFWQAICFKGSANRDRLMKKFLITLLLLAGAHLYTFSQPTGDDYVFRFPGTDLRGLAQLSAPARDSILQAFSRFDPGQVSFEGTEISAENREQLRTVILDMMETVKTVIKDPSSAAAMEKKMESLRKRMEDVQADIQLEEALGDLKADYEK